MTTFNMELALARLKALHALDFEWYQSLSDNRERLSEQQSHFSMCPSESSDIIGGCITGLMLTLDFGTSGFDWDPRLSSAWNMLPAKKKTATPNQKIQDLASAPSAIAAIRQDLIRCGFELEFQKLNGVNSESGGEIDFDGEVDRDLLSSRSSEALGELDEDEEVLAHMGSDASDVFEAINKLTGFCIQQVIGSLKSGPLRDKLECAWDSACSDWRDAWEENELDTNPEDYYPSKEAEVYDSLETNGLTRALIDCGDDQSVKGGEIRTVGPLKPMQFLSASQDLLENNDFTVDTGCSFHIHLSVPGVKHSYGVALQAEMTAYLLDNIKRLPHSVRNRLSSESCSKWAKLRLSTDKFTAVHFHGQGSWEFRLFGNIDDSSDARRCLILAIESMQHAYRVKLGMTKALVVSKESDRFAAMAMEVSQGVEFRGAVKKLRANERNAA
jgi:hypothetical protein